MEKSNTNISQTENYIVCDNAIILVIYIYIYIFGIDACILMF